MFFAKKLVPSTAIGRKGGEGKISRDRGKEGCG